MSRSGLLVIGAALGILALVMVYNSQRTTRHEAGNEIKEAAQATGDYIHDTAKEVKDDLKR